LEVIGLPRDDDRSCPGCGDDGMYDHMIDEFSETPVDARTAICENRDCRVRDFYVPTPPESEDDEEMRGVWDDF
jgi:hypothetical protein